MYIKKVTKVGNGHGILLDKALREMAHIEEGGKVVITFNSGKITIEPYNAESHKRLVDAVHEDVIRRHSKTLKKLAAT